MGIIGRFVTIVGAKGTHEVLDCQFSESIRGVFVLLLADEDGALWECEVNHKDVSLVRDPAPREKPTTKIKHLAVGTSFVLDPPQPGWFEGKLVLVAEITGGWAAPEGWDFIAKTDENQDFTVRILDESPPSVFEHVEPSNA